MDARTKKAIAREAAAKVARVAPAGTVLVRVATGTRAMIGARHGQTDFWMLELSAGYARGVVSASDVLKQYVTEDGECLL